MAVLPGDETVDAGDGVAVDPGVDDNIGDETADDFGDALGIGTIGFGLNFLACDLNLPPTLGRSSGLSSLLGETFGEAEGGMITPAGVGRPRGVIVGEAVGGIEGDDVDVARGPAFRFGVAVRLADGEGVAVATGGGLSIGVADAVAISARAMAGFTNKTNPAKATHAQKIQNFFILGLDTYLLLLFERNRDLSWRR